jgi:hypothetical protein
MKRKKTEYKIATLIFFGLAILGLWRLGTGNMFTFFCFWIGVYCAVMWYRSRDKQAIEKV